MAADVFDALADPTRRRLLELVSAQERTAGQLAHEFDLTRPAVSRHLRVLREAGLVTWRGDAQRRLYRIQPAGLAEIADWVERTVERTRDNWAARLDALEAHLDDSGKDRT